MIIRMLPRYEAQSEFSQIRILYTQFSICHTHISQNGDTYIPSPGTFPHPTSHQRAEELVHGCWWAFYQAFYWAFSYLLWYAIHSIFAYEAHVDTKYSHGLNPQPRSPITLQVTIHQYLQKSVRVQVDVEIRLNVLIHPEIQREVYPNTHRRRIKSSQVLVWEWNMDGSQLVSSQLLYALTLAQGSYEYHSEVSSMII